MSRDPFLLDQPACLQFSGGRTSGYMLRRVIDANGGRLPPGIVPVFCNTGKEDPGTLDFVDRCSIEWNVEIVWLEFTSRARDGFKVVNYATAARSGEPFEALIRTKQRLPNVVQRMCTQWLKVLTAHRYCVRVLGWDHYDSAIGLRADEPWRVAKLAPNEEQTPGETPIAPLAAAGVTLRHVFDFWQAQPFDLKLTDPEAGNCDACFLKGLGQRARIFARDPERARWWIEQERWVSENASGHSRFDKRISVEALVAQATATGGGKAAIDVR